MRCGWSLVDGAPNAPTFDSESFFTFPAAAIDSNTILVISTLKGARKISICNERNYSLTIELSTRPTRNGKEQTPSRFEHLNIILKLNMLKVNPNTDMKQFYEIGNVLMKPNYLTSVINYLIITD